MISQIPWVSLMGIIGVVVGAYLNSRLTARSQREQHERQRETDKDERALLKLEEAIGLLETVQRKIHFVFKKSNMHAMFQVGFDLDGSDIDELSQIEATILIYAPELKAEFREAMVYYTTEFNVRLLELLRAGLNNSDELEDAKVKFSECYGPALLKFSQLQMKLPNLIKERGFV